MPNDPGTTSSARLALGTGLVTVGIITGVASCLLGALMIAMALLAAWLSNATPAPQWQSYLPCGYALLGVVLSIGMIHLGRRVRAPVTEGSR